MLEHSLEVLEFYKIKEKLSSNVISGLGKSKVENIKFFKDKDKIKNSIREVSELVYLFKNTQLPSLKIFDIREELKRAKMENSYINPEGLIKVASTLEAIRNMKSYLKMNEEEAPSLQHYATELTPIKHIEDRIIQAIDKTNYEVKNTASRELAKIRIKISSGKNRIEKKLNSILHNPSLQNAIQESIITTREGRYVIPIKKDHKGKMPGIVLDTSSSGNTLFIEPSSIIEDNNSLMAGIIEEKQEIIRILKNITALITERWTEINNNLNTIGKIELLYAKTRLSIEQNAKEVDINSDGIFNITNAKHPLLTGNIVPINLKLGKEYNMLIVTGPNTGGKTVSLKTLGILTLMAMAGMHVPADSDSTISVVDNIFTDIGDEQSIQQNLSTFSAHVKRISRILKKATENSLILIDEIGAGTDPKEGSSIGIAILEELLKRKSKTMVSTHYAKIKNFSLQKEKVETASCEFDMKTLSPTYKILYGIPGESNAIAIAKRLGMDWKIIKRANKLFSKNSDKSESVIKTLTNERERYTKLLESYEKKLKLLSEKEEKQRIKELELKEAENLIKKGEIKETLSLLQDSRKEILNLMKEAKKDSQNIDNQKLGKKIGELDKIASKIRDNYGEKDHPLKEDIETLEYQEIKDEEIKENDKVKVKNLNKTGTVVDINKKGDITVQVGGIKFVLQKEDVIKIETNEKDKKNETSVSVTTTSEIYETPPFELNVIGMRGEEAVKRADKYIESLHYSDRNFGRIVHGKGEGILRRLIYDLLKNHPLIKSHQPAKPEHGGFGVTEIELKK